MENQTKIQIKKLIFAVYVLYAMWTFWDQKQSHIAVGALRLLALFHHTVSPLLPLSFSCCYSTTQVMDLIIKMTNYSIKGSARLGDIHKIRNIITNMHYTAKKLRHLSRLLGGLMWHFSCRQHKRQIQLSLSEEMSAVLKSMQEEKVGRKRKRISVHDKRALRKEQGRDK